MPGEFRWNRRLAVLQQLFEVIEHLLILQTDTKFSKRPLLIMQTGFKGDSFAEHNTLWHNPLARLTPAVRNVDATPFFPARPVRPMRCVYASTPRGMS